MKKKGFVFGLFGLAAGIAIRSAYQLFIEDHMPYEYRGNIVENALYFAGRDTLDMLCADSVREWFSALCKELRRR